ncbi:MAG: O-antigen ligase family protein, partial [Rhodothermia bacterium]|nr:O-antigen ligase family protein [Rhodothermia bacterium]NNL69127.1 O-antigen ligase family protein [Acidimicrobiia bacterium]
MSHQPEVVEESNRYLSPSGQSLLADAKQARATRINLPRTRATRTLTFAIVALPGAWALGLAEFMWPILVLPMAVFILRRSRILMPRAFFLWLAYVAIAIVAAVSAADGLRIITVYLAATIVFLFAYNASSDELPDSAIVALVALFWILVVVGGVLGLIFGTQEFPSLTNTLFVDEGQLETYWDDVTRVQLSDGLKVGEEAGLVLDHRPKGFLAYANHFGSAVVMFLPAVALLRLQLDRGRHSLSLDLVAVAAIFPFIISRNRWAWLSLLFIALYIVARLWRPFPRSARVMVIGLAMLLIVIAVTPLRGVVTDRLEGESSNQYRSEQYRLSWDLIQTSPWLGFGGNQESDEIAVTSQTVYEDLHLGADSQILQTMI